MALREDRDLAFWTWVYEHPEVKPHVGLGHAIDLGPLLDSPQVTPLRSDNGGFLFLRLDGLGRVYELHTLYRPEGWGREVLGAAREAFCAIFAQGCQLIVTHEVAGNWRSRPPKTFRFEPCGDFAPSPALGADLRTWALRQAAWEASPARQRM
jgi:hypothetical protein